MRAFVAITDGDWFEHLRALRPDEANFWKPSGKGFGAVDPGEPLLFKLHAPDNFVVGGGFLTHTTVLPASLAWRAYGEANGAATLDEMRARIARYRRVADDPHADWSIGCILLAEPFFFEREDWIPQPRSWKPQTQVGKTYDLTRGEGAELWEQVVERLQRQRARERPVVAEDAADAGDAVEFGKPYPVRARLGQGAFRLMVTDAYGRRCAVTGGKALPALDAAHIRPVREQGRHAVSNGILLRTDVHRLFDAGYVTVTPDLEFRASERLREDFNNGDEYLALSGTAIAVPDEEEDRPSKDFLEWHSDVLFHG